MPKSILGSIVGVGLTLGLGISSLSALDLARELYASRMSHLVSPSPWAAVDCENKGNLRWFESKEVSSLDCKPVELRKRFGVGSLVEPVSGNFSTLLGIPFHCDPSVDQRESLRKVTTRHADFVWISNLSLKSILKSLDAEHSLKRDYLAELILLDLTFEEIISPKQQKLLANEVSVSCARPVNSLEFVAITLNARMAIAVSSGVKDRVAEDLRTRRFFFVGTRGDKSFFLSDQKFVLGYSPRKLN
ncbi:MAG: hypothetical protein KF807_00160 [Xanthobacteraceae bacterium]|nr:hypothetical protein [Xanthobacteraceae bacterium]